MKDPRLEKLAAVLLDYSLDLKPGERLLIMGEAGSAPLVSVLIRAAYERKALPFARMSDERVHRAWLLGATREQMEMQVAWEIHRMKDIDATLHIMAGDNAAELSDVPGEIIEAMHVTSRPLMDIRLSKKWCLLRYPTPAAAQAAGMSTEAFEDFCLAVSTLDYARLSKAMDPLVELMSRTDQVRIVSPGTDLTFSIKGIPVLKAAGKNNIPDGEVYTAPVRESVNGTILFNTPCVEDGVTYERVRLTFKDGKVVDADANERQRLLQRLEADEGARYVGEFALGLNPRIDRPVRDVLYDEKIGGSLHLALGRAYDDADNGNRSGIHWDLVLLQTADWGGGELYFDDVLVRKDGLFVLPELVGLNPENLL
ncbi:MAG: aminopeptidase [Thermoleophilia bacterium]|nr:aminopeptidase [Thermoleophilia bacterium]